MENAVANVHNALLKDIFKLDVEEFKIFLGIVSKIDSMDEFPEDDFITIWYSKRDFAKSIGLYNNKKVYSSLKSRLKNMLKIPIEIEETIDGEVYIVNESLIRKTGFGRNDENDKFFVKIDREYYPFLYKLKSNFTSFKLAYVRQIRRKYSVRIYAYLKRINMSSFQIKTEKLYDKIDSNYSRWQDFRNRALDPAIDEINNFSDIDVSYSVLKGERNKVTHIKFNVRKKRDIDNKEIACDVDVKDNFIQSKAIVKNKYEIDDLIIQMYQDSVSDISESLGFSCVVIDKPTSLRLINLCIEHNYGSYDIQYFNEKLELTFSNKRENYMGFLVSAIKENYVKKKIEQPIEQLQFSKSDEEISKEHYEKHGWKPAKYALDSIRQFENSYKVNES